MKNLKKNQKNSSILTDNINPEGKLSELWEFNELMRKKQENTKEDDTFSIMDEVQDYDDLDYAVPMREEDIEQLFSNYMKNHNIPYIDERKYPEENKNQYSEFPIEKYPVLLN